MKRSQILCLNLYHIFIDGLYDSIPILLTFIVFHFGGNEKQIGFIVSCGSFVATTCGLCTLFFSQRFDFRRILGIVAFLYGIGFLLNSFSQSTIYIGIFFAIAVAGHTVFHNVSFSYITDKTNRKVLGSTLSDFTAYGDIGRIPLTALSGYVAAVSIGGVAGWRVICFSYGILVLGIGITLLLYKKQSDDTEHNNSQKSRRFLPLLASIREKNIKLVLWGSIINAFSSEQIFIFLPSLLLFKGFDHKILGALALGFTVGCFIGKTACGRLLDKFGTRKVFVVSQLILAIILILLIISDSLNTVIFIALLLGIVTKGTIPVIQSMITEPLPSSEYYNDVFTINGFVRGVVNVLAPTFFGLIGSNFNLNFTYSIMAISAVFAIVPVVLIKGIPSKNNVEI